VTGVQTCALPISQIWLTAGTGRQVWINKKGAKSERIEIALRKNNAE